MLRSFSLQSTKDCCIKLPCLAKKSLAVGHISNFQTRPRSSCRAIFFRNTHETTGEKIVSLKIARLNKSNGLLTEKQNKSVTLNSDELDKLIEYIQDYYAPLNIGMKEC